uniref:Reverse transcriptase Ty1/copia-type domain-containing protein n=1 Tax=Fagus sylvatica TaxID=28930 RepID=A0A2N9GU40_FAGSY
MDVPPRFGQTSGLFLLSDPHPAPVRSKDDDDDDMKFTDRLEDWDCKNHQTITCRHYTTAGLSHEYQLWGLLVNMKQAPKQMINEFLSSMQSIWDQLEQFVHIVKDPVDATILATKQDQFRLIQFLMALTSEFEPAHATLLQQDPRTNQVLGIDRRVGWMFKLTSLHLPSTLTPPSSHVAHTASIFPLSLWHLRLDPSAILRIPHADSPVFPLAPPPIVDPVLDQISLLPLAAPPNLPFTAPPADSLVFPKNLYRPWILSLIGLLPFSFVALTESTRTRPNLMALVNGIRLVSLPRDMLRNMGLTMRRLLLMLLVLPLHLQVIQTIQTKFVFFIALFMVLSKLLESGLPSLAVLCISLASYLDDHSGIFDFKQFPHQQFEMKDLGHLSYFLGLEVSSDFNGYYLSQAKYASDLLSRAGSTDIKVVSTPLKMNAHLAPLDGTPLSDATLYHQLIGSLVYLTVIRPDIAHAVHLHSKKQHIVFLSSTEAEYPALASTTSELLTLCWLLEDIGFTYCSPTVIHCDNRSAIQIMQNDVFHECTKHIEIDCHLVHHHLSAGILRLHPVYLRSSQLALLIRLLTSLRRLFFLAAFIGWYRVTITAPILTYHLPFYLFFIRSRLVWERFVGGLGDSSLQRILSLLSAHPCLSSGFRDLLWLWLFGGQPVWGSPPVRVSVRVSLDYSTFEVDSSKPLFEGPLPHLNRMASLAKATSIQLLRGLLGWDLDSKLAAVPDNNCCGCSYYLLDCRQNLCSKGFPPPAVVDVVCGLFLFCCVC